MDDLMANTSRFGRLLIDGRYHGWKVILIFTTCMYVTTAVFCHCNDKGRMNEEITTYNYLNFFDHAIFKPKLITSSHVSNVNAL